MTRPRIAFAGTPGFALASLAALAEGGFEPAVVLTQPDRPAGRGKKLAASPVKQFARLHRIEVQQPASLRDPAAVEALAAAEPDILIVAAYGLLLPQSVLDLPAKGCLNVHASLLPRWRGASPIQAAILAGDEETGVSLMAMTAGLDCGPVYATRSLTIGPGETAGELHDRLATLGGELLVAELPSILEGREAEPQDDALASYAGKIHTADAALDWHAPAAELARRVRAYNPVPGAWCMIGAERVKVWRAAAEPAPESGPEPGAVLPGAGVRVACGDGVLSLEELQRPGKRPVTAAEFAAQAGIAGQTLPSPAASG
jgi:methionyl-tRNA formyltransferase